MTPQRKKPPPPEGTPTVPSAPADPSFVVVGRIGAPHGVKGAFRVQSFTDPTDNLLAYTPLFLSARDQWQPAAELSLTPRGDGFLGSLPEVSDRDAATALRGRWIGVETATLPALDADEVYWHDLVGCRVLNADGELGVVREVLATGANDVLRVVSAEGADGECLVPYVEPYVLDVDIPGRCLRVDWQADW